MSYSYELCIIKKCKWDQNKFYYLRILLQTNEDIVVFRTCSEDYFKEYEIGECFQIDQFLSTSITRIGPFARGINYKIYINKNTSGCAIINQLSYYKKQKELLIDKSMFLRVLSRKRNLIEIEVICNG